jgi:hypothetical protein
MNRASFFSLFCVALLVSSLCMAGCARDRAERGVVTDMLATSPVITTAPAAGIPATPAPAAATVTSRAVKVVTGRTCSQLGGDICPATGNCPGSWMEAVDSFSCCSQSCTGMAGEVLTIEPFEPLPADEEQVSISP